MTKELLQAIYQNHKQTPQDDGKLPISLQKTSTDKKSLKERELIATAVKSTVYMFPNASPIRAGMIAQSMLLIFLHDDVVEESPVDAGSTITDAILAPWIGTNAEKAQHPLHDFLKAVIDEEPILGKSLLAGAFAWIKHTKGYQSIPPTVFDSLRNYLDYRSVDIGRELLLAQAAFACNVQLSEPEMEVFDRLISLYSDHISLTNDLYSFDKEYGDHCRTGAVLINALDVVRKVHQVSEFIAKQLVRESILKVETEFAEEYKRLSLPEKLSDKQQRFVEALTLCLVGHIFYSATSGRYGGASAAL
ncbi:isoprenoid synthase domain-containing protein [Aspergillus desertorum]